MKKLNSKQTRVLYIVSSILYIAEVIVPIAFELDNYVIAVFYAPMILLALYFLSVGVFSKDQMALNPMRRSEKYDNELAVTRKKNPLYTCIYSYTFHTSYRDHRTQCIRIWTSYCLRIWYFFDRYTSWNHCIPLCIPFSN